MFGVGRWRFARSFGVRTGCALSAAGTPSGYACLCVRVCACARSGVSARPRKSTAKRATVRQCVVKAVVLKCRRQSASGRSTLTVPCNTGHAAGSATTGLLLSDSEHCGRPSSVALATISALWRLAAAGVADGDVT